jgi:hypothetical protein
MAASARGAPGHGQVVMDLVGDEHQVVRGAEFGQRRAVPRRSRAVPPGLCGEQRITMRSVPVELPLERGQIHEVAAVAFLERASTTRGRWRASPARRRGRPG